MTTPAAKQAAEQAETIERVAPLVQTNCVWQNKAGSRWCQWEAVAPEGATFDDLLDPAAWKRVQDALRPALRQDDEIRVKAFDRSWVVWCFVAHATGNGVVLSKFADTKPGGPREHLFEDDRYAVRYLGSGYAGHRKTDGQKMTDIFSSADRARIATLELSPKVVA